MRNIIDLYLEGKEIPVDGVGIYHLLKEKDIVYVGQSTNLRVRICDHVWSDEKEFDDVEFFPMPASELNDAEAADIVKHNPIYNKILSSNSLYVCEKNITEDVSKMIISLISDEKIYTSKRCGQYWPRNYYRKNVYDILCEDIRTCINKAIIKIKAGEK